MVKFSIIIPVYNVEKYIKKCLDSVMEQTFKDYEVIVVNDGTKDNSMEIVKKYNVKVINQKNKGLSEARNVGVKHCSGEYIIFLDSDDYIKKDLLKEINLSLDNNPDIVRYQVKKVWDNSEKTKDYEEEPFYNLNGIEAFAKIVGYNFVELACLYAIKKDYYMKNKFNFKKGMVHEDFGLIPLIIARADVVNSISYIGYYYVQRTGSIMNCNTYERNKKKVDDVYNHFKYLSKELNKLKRDTWVVKSYISNALIEKITELNGNDYKKYLSKIRKEKVFDNLLNDSIARKLKNIIIKINPKLYYRNK